MPKPTSQQRFLALSKVVTGHDDLDANLVEPYYQRIKAAFAADVDPLLAAFAGLPGVDPVGEVRFSILGGADGARYSPVVQAIVNIWFLGQFTKSDGTVSPPAELSQYKKQLMYPEIGAPVRGYSTLSYGYWVEKPAMP
jgi:hypothetical protein